MSNFKSPGIKKRILIICMAVALCVPLFLLAQKNKDKTVSVQRTNCLTVTADAEFGDDSGDGICSDGEYSIYGDKTYYGLEDILVCLLIEQDHDFLLSTQGKTKYERSSGTDRKVTLDFSANANDLSLLPFYHLQVVDALIRVDEVLSETGYPATEKRFILWFKVGRNDYRLVFDGLIIDELNGEMNEWVSVIQAGNAEPGPRHWTIESTGSHKARLENDQRAKRYTIGHFIMPFKMTVTERQDKPPTCL